MQRDSKIRQDTSAGAVIDLSPDVIAQRVKRLAMVRRTAKVALRARMALAEAHGRAKS